MVEQEGKMLLVHIAALLVKRNAYREREDCYLRLSIWSA